MVKIVANDRRLTEGCAVLVIITDIKHTFPGCVCSDRLIQRRPIIAAFLRIDVMIQFIQLRVMLM